MKSILLTGCKLELPRGHKMYVYNKTFMCMYPGSNTYEPISENELSKIVKSHMFWETQNGDIIEITKMSTSHITNVLKRFSEDSFKSKHTKDLFREYKSEFDNILRSRNIDKVLNHDDYIGLSNVI